MTNKQAMMKWEVYKKVTATSDYVPNEDDATKMARIQYLKSDFEAFCKYYFPKFASAPFADFHLRFAQKLIDNDEMYIVRAWAREHAKSVVAGLFVPLFLKFTGKLRNMLLVSHSYDKACELLDPIMGQLERNERLISDFGQQKTWRNWSTGHFVTRDGCSFRAFGAGQNPRGTRNDENRPDFIMLDDIDTDEECRNEERIKKKWEWIEQALLPTFSISGSKRFVVVGNIIAKNSIVTRAIIKAKDYEKINILDENGNPSWARNTIAKVNFMIE